VNDGRLKGKRENEAMGESSSRGPAQVRVKQYESGIGRLGESSRKPKKLMIKSLIRILVHRHFRGCDHGARIRDAGALETSFRVHRIGNYG